MDKFTVTKRILANGRRWDELVGYDDTVSGMSLFKFGNIREAWLSLENNFCKDTVKQMVDAISSHVDEPEENIVYRDSDCDNTIEAFFFRKDFYVPEGTDPRDIPEGIPVTYAIEGDLDNPVEYQI